MKRKNKGVGDECARSRILLILLIVLGLVLAVNQITIYQLTESLENPTGLSLHPSGASTPDLEGPTLTYFDNPG